jgi:hypothetical protein
MWYQEERDALWHDETVHPCSMAMIVSMRAQEADMGLVKEWQDFTKENFEQGDTDWLPYADWLGVELEITLDNLVDITVKEVDNLLMRARVLTVELMKGTNLNTRVLVRGVQTGGPAPAPEPPLDVRVGIPGHFYAKVSVLHEEVTLEGFIFEPLGSSAGYFGPIAEVALIQDSDGGLVSGPEQEAMSDFLNPHHDSGPFWQVITEHFETRQTDVIEVRWEA